MPLYAAGQKIRGSEINSLPQTFWVDTNQTVNNNSSSLQPCVGLSFFAEANVTYLIEFCLAVSTNATADIKMGISAPAGVSGWWSAFGVTSSGAVTGSLDAGIFTNFSGLHARAGDNGTPVYMMPVVSISLGATAGTVQLVFAQNTQNASNTTILAGSAMRVTRKPG